MPRLILILIAALALVLAACSADDEAGTPGTDSNDSGPHGHREAER